MSPDELEAFSFFEQSVCHRGNLFDSTIWGKYVGRADNGGIAMRSMVAALGAITRPNSLYQDKSNMHSRCALVSYQRATRALQDHLSKQAAVDRELVLVTCILFVLFDAQNGDWLNARRHLTSGTRILNSGPRPAPQNDNGPTRNTPNVDLSMAYAHLEWQMWALSGDFHTTVSRTTAPPVITSLPPLLLPQIVRFETLSGAREAAETIRTFVWQFSQQMQMIRTACMTEEDVECAIRLQKAGLTTIEHWEMNLANVQNNSIGMKELQELQVLRLPLLCYRLWLTTALASQRELCWDDHMRDLRCIFDLIREILGQGAPGAACSMSYGIDATILVPAHFVLQKCRCPVIRTELIKFLRTCDHRDGLWSASLVADIGERIMHAEHGGHDVQQAADIPEKRRIFVSRVTISSGRLGALECLRRDFEHDGDWISYTIQ